MDANGKLFQIILQSWALIHHWPHYTETGHPHPHHPLTPITNTWNKSEQGSAEGNWIKYRDSLQEKVRKKAKRGDLRILVQANKGLYKLKGKEREREVSCWRGMWQMCLHSWEFRKEELRRPAEGTAVSSRQPPPSWIVFESRTAGGSWLAEKPCNSDFLCPAAVSMALNDKS